MTVPAALVARRARMEGCRADATDPGDNLEDREDKG